MSKGALPSDLQSRIKAEYDKLGYDQGYTLFGSPAQHVRTARYGIIGLNPGGDGRDEVYDTTDHVIEREFPGRFWSSVTRMVTQLNWHTSDFFYAQFIPFRSPTIDTLRNDKLAYKFALELWCEILPSVSAEVLLCCGNLAADAIARADEAPRSFRREGPFNVYDRSNGGRIIRVPHPSRSNLFSAANASESGAILRELVKI